MKHIKGVTLREFVRTNPMNLRDKLIITIKLLKIVHEIHSRNIVHRYIKPEDIIIRTPINPDEIDLVLIDFSKACLIQNDETNNRMIFDDDLDDIMNTFYQATQLERQSSTGNENHNQQNKNLVCSPSIDTSSVCAVLSWLITGRDPKESKNINGEAPHQLKAHINIIDEELKKATGKSKNSNFHFNKIFFVKEFGQK
jgi:serine/threonine protein kinase